MSRGKDRGRRRKGADRRRSCHQEPGWWRSHRSSRREGPQACIPAREESVDVSHLLRDVCRFPISHSSLLQRATPAEANSLDRLTPCIPTTWRPGVYFWPRLRKGRRDGQLSLGVDDIREPACDRNRHCGSEEEWRHRGKTPGVQDRRIELTRDLDRVPPSASTQTYSAII